MINNEIKRRIKIEMGSDTWSRHPRNRFIMHKRDFEITVEIRKRISHKDWHYSKKLEEYDSTFYFHDILGSRISEFRNLLDLTENEFDIYLENDSDYENQLMGKFIDYVINQGHDSYFSMDDAEWIWWDNNALFVIFFDYYMCTIKHRIKYSERLNKIEGQFRNVRNFLQDTKFDWMNCFLPRLQYFFDEDITTGDIIEAFANIFDYEVDWD